MQKTTIKINLINPEEIYQSIKSGKPYNNKNLRLYTQSEIESAIRQFILDEEYEKCSILKNFIDKRFTHENGWNQPITF
jgi:hypothetical protein